jgi:hypothetical protein
VRRPVARPRGLTAAAVLFAAASVCALASAAPAAASSGYGQLIVNPGIVSPGQSVSILGTCPNNGSPLTGVFSAAFDGGQASVSQGSVNFTGSATIANGVSAGSYEVSAKCGPGSPMVVITVSGAGGGMTTPSATTPGGSSWSSSAASSGMSHKYPSSPASLGNAGPGAMGGGMKPTKPSSAASAGMSATAGAGAAAGSSVNATNPPVTSTGIVRVGLAGSGRSNMTTPVAAAAAAAIVITGAVGFLMLRRRRNTHGTHS